MIEITTTNMNPNTIPHLHVWGWEVPVYLFLGGLSAGLLVISACLIILNKDAVNSRAVKIGSILAPIMLNLGMVALFLDLAYKWHVLMFYTRFIPTSPMSWGAWVLLIFMPFSFLQAFIALKDFFNKFPILPTIIRIAEPHLKKIAYVNVFIGTVVGIYTGILLSSLFARALWSNAALGLVFLLSGLSAGAALLLIIAEKEEKHTFSRIDMILIAIEAVAICLFVIGSLMGTANVREAMTYLITGPYAMSFWIITILGGILIPLIFEGLENAGKVKYTMVIPVLVLVGSLSLRFIIVYAGQAFPTVS